MAKKSNVYKDKNGWYFKASLGIDPITGKRRTKTQRGFKTEKEARSAYMRFMVEWEIHHEEWDEQEKAKKEKQAKDMTFGEFRDNIFLPWYKSQVKPNTYYRRVNYLSCKFSFLENKIMREVSRLDVQMFQNTLVSQNLSGSYVNLLLGFGGIIWDRARIFDLVDENPFRQIGRVRSESKKIRFWTLQNFKDFERNIFPSRLEEKVKTQQWLEYEEYYDFYHYLYFRFLFFTGVRFGESATLLWENVDLDTGKIRILYTLGNTCKKKDEQYFSSPKIKSSERELYLDSRTLQLLRIWKYYQSISGDIKLVFSHDGTFIYQRWMWKKFRTLQEKYDLPIISVHDLRHSHASLLVHIGENPKMIQKRLGHANIEMTLGTYSHLYPNEDLEVVRRLEQVNN